MGDRSGKERHGTVYIGAITISREWYQGLVMIRRSFGVFRQNTAVCPHMMQGTPNVYQGEELGMTNVPFRKTGRLQRY